jgi:hypothetical protein
MMPFMFFRFANPLQSLVMACPHISRDMKALGTVLLKDAAARFRSPSSGSYMHPGAVLRYVGTYPGDTQTTTEPVLLVTVPLRLWRRRGARLPVARGAPARVVFCSFCTDTASGTGGNSRRRLLGFRRRSAPSRRRR